MWQDLLRDSIKNRYDLYNFGYAVEILSQTSPEEFQNICDALDAFCFTENDIVIGGGNESAMPKKMARLLRPLGWKETKISADLTISVTTSKPKAVSQFTLEKFLDGYKIDYVKNKVAFDMEWNSKDQTFDRDLTAFRAFYETGVINCGVIITRSLEMNDAFRRLGIMNKYGASTTHMGKLLSRIQSRRHGGCPLFVIGITSHCITDETVLEEAAALEDVEDVEEADDVEATEVVGDLGVFENLRNTTN